MSEKEMSLFLKPDVLRPQADHGSEITRRFTMNMIGRIFAAAIQDRSIRLYDARNCDEIQRMTDEYLTTSIAFSPRGDIVATGSVGRLVKLWDIRTASNIATLEGHSYPILSLSFSPDGDKLVSGSGDTTLKIWDIENHTELKTLKGHTLYVKTCAWDPKDNRIISGSIDATIREWDPSTGETTHIHDNHRTAVHAVRFRPDGEQLASGSSDNTIIIWDSSSKLRATGILYGHQNEVRALSFSTDGKYLASGSSDKELFVWSLDTQTLQGESRTDSEVDGIEWYPDQSAFLSCDGTGAIIRWNVTDLNEILAPFQDLLQEIESDPELLRRDEFIGLFEEIVSRYDEETLKDKRLFYAQWQCKKALGLLKGKVRKVS